MSRVAICGGGSGHLGMALAMAAMASMHASPVLGQVYLFKPSPPDFYGYKRPPFKVGGGHKWRSHYPGKPRPHITPDPTRPGGFTTRVKGFKPRFTPLREYEPPAPNYKGSRYEKERNAAVSDKRAGC